MTISLGDKMFEAALTELAASVEEGKTAEFIDQLIDSRIKSNEQIIKMHRETGIEPEMSEQLSDENNRLKNQRDTYKEMLQDPKPLLALIKAQSYQVSFCSTLIDMYNKHNKAEKNDKPEEKLYVPEYIIKGLEKNGTSLNKALEESRKEPPKGLTAGLLEDINIPGCAIKDTAGKQTLAFPKPLSKNASVSV